MDCLSCISDTFSEWCYELVK
uniref:Uncharacterized protein n=1 Tax=Anguilla anguilla TaxID=7936 RepID=A0A0E9RS37_ANGAN